MFFFFFQAEDGIRDSSVTGVQTCALPIYGAVAMPPTPKNIGIPGFIAPSVGDTGWLSAEQGWLVSGSHLYWTSDLGKNWRDISPASTQLAYFLPSGQAWALGTQAQDFLSPDHTTAWGAYWDRLD